ncbi:hypothetical protein M1D96_06460 [Pseudomonas sp. D1-3]
MKFPAHKCGLYLEHNANRDYYESVEQYLEDQGERFQFSSQESRSRCIESGEIWTLQWYPNTPIGSISVAAPTLEELLEFANEGEQE